MKLKASFVFLIIISLISSIFNFYPVYAGNVSKNSFRYYKEVTSGSDGYVKLPIDVEMYTGTNLQMSDIRIFNSQDREIPYYIRSSSGPGISPETLMIRIINKSYTSDSLLFTIDREDNKETANKMEIFINKSDKKDYLYIVNLKASDDGSKWYNINSTGYLYVLSDIASGKGSIIYFDDNNYRYLRVELRAKMGTLPSSGELDSVNLSYNSTGKSNETQLDSSISKKDDKGRKTIITIDNKYNFAAFDKISINTPNTNFNRSISVYGSNDGNNWEGIAFNGRNEVFAYSIKDVNVANTSVELSRSRYRYIRMEIDNKDNLPLEISGIDVYNSTEYIIFNSSSKEKYFVYFGNSIMKAPEYDIQKFISLIDFNTLPEVKSEELKDNTGFTGEDKPLSERYSWLIWVVIVVMVGTLGYMIIKNLKKVGSSE